VRVQSERWQARCEAGVAAGEAIRVASRDGLVLVVEPAQRVASASGG
jgi:membrane-bound ClpP family serine protease